MSHLSSFRFEYHSDPNINSSKVVAVYVGDKRCVRACVEGARTLLAMTDAANTLTTLCWYSFHNTAAEKHRLFNLLYVSWRRRRRHRGGQGKKKALFSDMGDHGLTQARPRFRAQHMRMSRHGENRQQHLIALHWFVPLPADRRAAPALRGFRAHVRCSGAHAAAWWDRQHHSLLQCLLTPLRADRGAACRLGLARIFSLFIRTLRHGFFAPARTCGPWDLTRTVRLGRVGGADSDGSPRRLDSDVLTRMFWLGCDRRSARRAPRRYQKISSQAATAVQSILNKKKTFFFAVQFCFLAGGPAQVALLPHHLPPLRPLRARRPRRGPGIINMIIYYYHYYIIFVVLVVIERDILMCIWALYIYIYIYIYEPPYIYIYIWVWRLPAHGQEPPYL